MCEGLKSRECYGDGGIQLRKEAAQIGEICAYDMTLETDFTGIIEIGGVWFVVEDGVGYYFDEADKDD